jgi:hypothetical protein
MGAAWAIPMGAPWAIPMGAPWAIPMGATRTIHTAGDQHKQKQKRNTGNEDPGFHL